MKLNNCRDKFVPKKWQEKKVEKKHPVEKNREWNLWYEEVGRISLAIGEAAEELGLNVYCGGMGSPVYVAAKDNTVSLMEYNPNYLKQNIVDIKYFVKYNMLDDIAVNRIMRRYANEDLWPSKEVRLANKDSYLKVEFFQQNMPEYNEICADCFNRQIPAIKIWAKKTLKESLMKYDEYKLNVEKSIKRWKIQHMCRENV